LRHILTYGIKENRNIIIDKNIKNRLSIKSIKNNFDLLLPKDFIWNEYTSLYSDLKHMDENEAKIHYILYGNYEGRKYNGNDLIIKYNSNLIVDKKNIENENENENKKLSVIYGNEKVDNKQIPTHTYKKQKISVVILNYLRPESAKKIIHNLLKSECIDEIIISNCNKDKLINYNDFNNSKIVIKNDYGINNDKWCLHLRFFHAREAKNNKILIIDDDILVSDMDLNNLLTSDSTSIVGFYARDVPYSSGYERDLTKNIIHYAPIVLTKCILINKQVAEIYCRLIEKDSKLIDLMRQGVPWGNGEDILLCGCNFLLTNQFNICLKKNNITDLGSHDDNAICNRGNKSDHWNYRIKLTNFIFKNRSCLSDEFIKVCMHSIYYDRLEYYLGNNINNDKVFESSKSCYKHDYNSIQNYFPEHNKFYYLFFRTFLEDKHKEKNFLAQWGDRCKNTEKVYSWSFSNNNIEDNFE